MYYSLFLELLLTAAINALDEMIIRHKVQDHPLEVFGYACKHDYNDIANKAAPMTLGTNAKQISKILGPDHLLRWVRTSSVFMVIFMACPFV